MNFVGAANGGWGRFGEAEIFYFAGFDQFGHSAYGVFDRRVRVDAMLVIEIDVIDAKAFQGSVAGGADVFGLATDDPIGGIVFFADVGKFCGEENFIAAGTDGFAG